MTYRDVTAGRESLDELEEMVTESLGSFKTDDKPRLNYGHLPPPMSPDEFHRLVKVVPVKDKHQLELNWLLPDMFDQCVPACPHVPRNIFFVRVPFK
jgi:secreted Zn-dependent insulinase-like peptidase